MSSKMIAVTLPEKLIKTLNAEALINYESRSEYVKRAIIARLKADGINIAAEPRNRDEVERKKLTDFWHRTRQTHLWTILTTPPLDRALVICYNERVTSFNETPDSQLLLVFRRERGSKKE